MIIFDLDGTLANIDHRRHFVDPSYNENFPPVYTVDKDLNQHLDGYENPLTGKKFKPDWKAFNEACDMDEHIVPAHQLYCALNAFGYEIEIWSGRSESVKEKTMDWLDKWGILKEPKMRPIGDFTPDDQLKERWLDEYIANMWPKLLRPAGIEHKDTYHRKDPIEFVFDDRPKVIRMWRRRGIFVFNCCQHDKEF